MDTHIRSILTGLGSEGNKRRCDSDKLTDPDVCFHSKNQQQFRSERLENVTQTISRLLQGYDIRLRPNFGGES